jgi:very-short-patch-repair endonuclease
MNTKLARTLRRTQTDVERKLWQALRGRRLAGFKFRRQQPVGRYIVDFISFEAHLVVELDGSQHVRPDIAARDAQRTAYLESCGYRVLRFFNCAVSENLDGVADAIFDAARSAR